MLIKVQDLKRKNFLDTLQIQESLRNKVLKNNTDNYLILVEHDHVYTLGNNANSKNILKSTCEIIQTQRGGDVTYHGPGQLVAYPIINLKKKKIGVKNYISMIEKLISNILIDYNLEPQILKEETGVWVQDKKIASIGIHVTRGVTKVEGLGAGEILMTSMDKELGKKIRMNDIKKSLITHFNQIF